MGDVYDGIGVMGEGWMSFGYLMGMKIKGEGRERYWDDI